MPGLSSVRTLYCSSLYLHCSSVRWHLMLSHYFATTASVLQWLTPASIWTDRCDSWLTICDEHFRSLCCNYSSPWDPYWHLGFLTFKPCKWPATSWHALFLGILEADCKQMHANCSVLLFYSCDGLDVVRFIKVVQKLFISFRRREMCYIFVRHYNVFVLVAHIDCIVQILHKIKNLIWKLCQLNTLSFLWIILLPNFLFSSLCCLTWAFSFHFQPLLVLMSVAAATL